MTTSSYQAGRHFLQIPGPTNVPDRVLRAMDYPTMDHRGPAFADVGRKALEGMKAVFKASPRGDVASKFLSASRLSFSK